MVALTTSLVDRIRSNQFIWGVRIFQAIFAFSILGICASNAAGWANLGCSTPSRLGYHLAAAALTLFPVVFFILTSGPLSYTTWWRFWIQISLDSLFIIFWIAAAAVSNYTCDGICSSCSAAGQQYDDGFGFPVSVGSLTCLCSDPNYDYTGLLRMRGKSARSFSSGSLKRVGEKSTDIAAKQGLDGSMIFLLFVTLLTAIYLRFGRSEKEAQNAAIEDAEAQTEQVGTGIDLGNNAASNT